MGTCGGGGLPLLSQRHRKSGHQASMGKGSAECVTCLLGRGQDRGGEVQGEHWAAQRPLDVVGTALHGDPSAGLELPPGVRQEERKDLGL